MLEVRVCEIKGKCPVYNIGDKIVIDSLFQYKMSLEGVSISNTG